MAQLERVAILGGTFDPPHLAHISMAECALAQLRLDAVWWIPVGDPPHKPSEDLTAGVHRFEMTRLTLQSAANEKFAILRTDFDRPGPHYMVDTIAILKREFWNLDPYLLIGEDSLFDLPLWHEPGPLVDSVMIAVYPRYDVRRPLSELEEQLPGITERVVYLDGKTKPISSSSIRDRVRANQSINALVVPEVLAYIRTNRLYETSR